MDDFKEFFLPLLGILGGALALIIALGVIFAFIFGPPVCHAQWDNSGYQARWTLFGDCQIQVEGNWIPADAFKNIKLQGKQP